MATLLLLLLSSFALICLLSGPSCICSHVGTPLTTVGATVISKRPSLKAIFVFGDSLLDPGNDEKLLTLARANRLPYGRDLPDHRPSGRFCNGLLTSDIIGMPPPYLPSTSNLLKVKCKGPFEL